MSSASVGDTEERERERERPSGEQGEDGRMNK